MKISVFYTLILTFILCPSILSAKLSIDEDSTIDSISALQKRAIQEKDTDTNKAIATILQAIELATSIEHDSLIQRTKNSYSLYLLMHTQYEKSKEIIHEILPLYEQQGRDFQIGILFRRLGIIELKLDNYQQAHEYLLNTLESIPQKYIKQHGITHTYLCDVLVRLGNYQEALEHIEISLKLLKESDNQQYYTMALTELGKLHYQIEDYDQARAVFTESLKNEIENEQFKIIPTVHLGILEYKSNNSEKAIDYLRQAENFMLETGNVYELSTVYLFLSQIKKDNAYKAEALVLAKKSLDIAQDHKLNRQIQLSKLLLSELSIESDNVHQALNYSNEVLDYNTQHQDFELESKAHELIAQAYAKLGNYKRSYNHQIAHQTANNLYFNSKNIIDVTGKTTKYRLENERLIHEQAQKSKLRISKLIRNVVLGFSLLLSIFTFILSQLNRKRKNAIQQLEKNNLILRQTEKKLDIANQLLLDKNKKLESYIDVNLQLENFAHIAAHDLKAPLREQASFIQLLEKNTLLALTEKDRHYLSYISKSNSNMQTLIEDMIEYSLLKSDEYTFEPINPELIIKKAQYLNRDLIHKEDAKIIIHEMPSKIEADSNKIMVVFRNLIHNSLTYTRKGIKPIIEIGCEKKKESYVFYVRDNGRGIPSTYRDEVFDVFKSFSKDLNANFTGIGLAMVKQVIEKHSGKVWLDSDTTEGSTFYFSIAA